MILKYDFIFWSIYSLAICYVVINAKLEVHTDYYLSIGDKYRTAISLIRLTNEHDRQHNTAKKEDHSPQTGKMLFLNIFRTGLG
jgi:hypothetical protein